MHFAAFKAEGTDAFGAEGMLAASEDLRASCFDYLAFHNFAAFKAEGTDAFGAEGMLAASEDLRASCFDYLAFHK
jgi:hypothetical protein